MKFESKEVPGKGVRLSLQEEGKEIGRAYLYVLHNDLHKEPFGLLEDVFVSETFRGKGYGEKLVRKAVEEAKRLDCYKLVFTNRYGNKKIHAWYKRMGFRDTSKGFRMDL